MDTQIKHAFDVLEVPYNATFEETKQAYRDLIQIWHPDKHHGNDRLRDKGTEKLKEINAAWEDLKNWFAEYEQETLRKKEQKRRDKEASARRTKERESAERADSERKTNEDARYFHIDCPSCGTTNRVLRDKSEGRAKCGSCGKFIRTKERESAERADSERKTVEDARFTKRSTEKARNTFFSISAFSYPVFGFFYGIKSIGWCNANHIIEKAQTIMDTTQHWIIGHGHIPIFFLKLLIYSQWLTFPIIAWSVCLYFLPD